jgi:hypothetical protein
MPDTLEQVVDQTTPETAPAAAEPQVDINAMSVDELEKFVSSKPGEATPVDAKQEAPTLPGQTPKADQAGWIEIDIDDQKLKFANDEEFKKSFVNAQKLI